MILTLSGLPASGKSTYALAWVAEDPDHRIRINYDDLRLEMFGPEWVFNHKDEARMKAKAQEKAIAAIIVQKDIIIDNLNLTTQARKPWEKLAEDFNTPYSNHEIHTPLSECIERDRLRQGKARVGRAVIERWALFTGWIDWHDLGQRHAGKDIVLVDIDGTLSDPTHRLHHIKDTNPPGENVNRTMKRWDLFNAEVDKDLPKTEIVELVNHLSYYYHIIIVSGRSTENGCGIKTEDWLDDRDLVYQHLFMRQSGDRRDDFVHKQEILDLLPKDRIAFVIDDRQQVVDMWRRNGLTCLQCAKGDF